MKAEMDTPQISTTTASGYRVRTLASRDIDTLEPVLREHVRDLHSGAVVDSEVAAIKTYMQGAADEDGRSRSYLVVVDGDDKAIACMALAVPERRMAAHFAEVLQDDVDRSVELLNAFVASAHLGGKGVGRMLLTAICALGAAQGAHTLLVNSGPRYRHSWAFYDRVCDSSHGLIDDYYGLGRHAQTWKKALASLA